MVATPIFLPVGSQATVRTLTPHDLDSIGIKMVLCNSYHLYLRPGVDVITQAGGLHKFMSWDKPILTDSGGYQIFSLSSLRDISEDGVQFRSHVDGSRHKLTPESAIMLQEALGADIIMALDVCPESNAKVENLLKALELTAEWASRCKTSHTNTDQLLFGIIQGGTDPNLRKTSARQITSIDFPGYAIGGLSLGESKLKMWSTVNSTVGFMPDAKPRYLMGVGSPEDIFEGVAMGLDIFDSALPTRVARNGALFTRTGRINIKRSTYKMDMGPVDASCTCYTCSNYSSAYIHHLFKSEELLAYRLATIHNLHFINKLLIDIRSAVADGKFDQLKNSFLSGYNTTNEETRLEQKLKSVHEKIASRGECYE
jgi:queuine tRNA-ribosyltransferase